MNILIVIALHLGCDIRQWDVLAAYLQATLKHEIYVSDINEDCETEYWMLHKELYGLKQAGHEWYYRLIDILQEAKFNPCVGDEAYFRMERPQETIAAALGTHIDDILWIGPKTILDETETEIEQTDELDRRGKPGNMLGMELQWGKDYVIRTQTGLIDLTTWNHELAKDAQK